MSEPADFPVVAKDERQRQSAARLAFGAAVVVLALWSFSEYLPALGWAGVIAIATWPFYKKIRARVGHGHALPIGFAVGVGLIFLAPVVGLGWVADAYAGCRGVQQRRHFTRTTELRDQSRSAPTRGSPGRPTAGIRQNRARPRRP